MLRIRLRNRFLLYCLPLILGVLIQGGWCIWTFATVYTNFNHLRQRETENASAMLDLKKLLLSLEIGIRKQQFDRKIIREKANQLSLMISKHGQHKHNSLTPTEEAAHEMLHHAIFATTLSQYLLKKSEQSWPINTEELLQISEAIREERMHLEQAIDRHLRLHIAQIDRTENFIGQQYQQTLTVVLLTSLAVISLTLLVVFLMMRSVLEPVKRLQEGTRQIGKGNLSYQVRINSGDEFEFLAKEFGKMAQQLAGYHNELDELVNIDSLTHVANRRYFDTRLEQEWRELTGKNTGKGTGKGKQLAVIFVDIDYFKQYNDTYGHQAGDECLRQVGYILQHTLRHPTDLAARYGGEEFILLLPGSNSSEAEQLAQDIQQALEKLCILHEKSSVSTYVTCSMGIAVTIPTGEVAVASLVAAADHALYQAKAQGRNQYVISSKENNVLWPTSKGLST